MKKLLIGCTVAGLVLVTARPDRSEPRPSRFIPTVPQLRFAPQAPYTVSEICVSSWYGEPFQGRHTANGEIYDMNGLTVASRELPLGTKVKVTNLANKRSLFLRVNDRGPYIAGRNLDVSKAAAKRLGFMAAGLALVQVNIVSYPQSYKGNQPPNGLDTSITDSE